MASSFADYLDSVKARDPAARSRWEILIYPGVWALGLHRVAHWLYGGQLYFLRESPTMADTFRNLLVFPNLSVAWLIQHIHSVFL